MLNLSMTITCLIVANRGSRAPVVFLQDPSLERLRHGVCPRACTYSVDKSNDQALSAGSAPFMSPPGALVFGFSHAITSGDSFGAGCLTASQDHHNKQESGPGATRLDVGPRESRAGSRVPRYTSSSPVVQAACQGGAVHAPGALRSRESPSTYKWKHHAPR